MNHCCITMINMICSRMCCRGSELSELQDDVSEQASKEV